MPNATESYHIRHRFGLHVQIWDAQGNEADIARLRGKTSIAYTDADHKLQRCQLQDSQGNLLFRDLLSLNAPHYHFKDYAFHADIEAPAGIIRNACRRFGQEK